MKELRKVDLRGCTRLKALPEGRTSWQSVTVVLLACADGDSRDAFPDACVSLAGLLENGL